MSVSPGEGWPRGHCRERSHSMESALLQANTYCLRMDCPNQPLGIPRLHCREGEAGILKRAVIAIS